MKNAMRYAVLATRMLLGAVFLVFGLNGFFNFIPMEPPQGAAGQFMGGLAASGYLFPLMKGTEVLAGAALLAGRFVPLALTVLAPIMINIVAFHLFLAPEGTGMGVGLALMQAFLVWAYRDSFTAVLSAKARPKERKGATSAEKLGNPAVEGA